MFNWAFVFVQIQSNIASTSPGGLIERNSTSLSRIDDVTDIDLRPCRPPLLQGETDAEHWRAEVELVLILVLGISEKTNGKLIFYTF